VTNLEEAAPQINIELEDLQELARINPLAWEQLLHIADSGAGIHTASTILELAVDDKMEINLWHTQQANVNMTGGGSAGSSFCGIKISDAP